MPEILTSLHGRRVGLTDQDALVSIGGFISGSGADQIIMPSARNVVLFDDFLGDVVADQWNFTEGTDSSTSDGGIVEGVNGVYRLTAGDSAGSVAADYAQLNSALGWKANQGGLRLAARIALGSIASASCFFGFTDTKSLEGPIYASGTANGLTSDASDAVGFMFDTAMTDDTWWLVGVKGDTDATAQNTTIAPVAATYETLAVELDTSGNARFWRNGALLGNVMTNALTATVALTPHFGIRPKSAAAGKTMDIDWVNVSANRV